jgi:hypothetical protein
MNIKNHVSDQWCGEHIRFGPRESFRVSNNAKQGVGGGTREGFSLKFVEHGCYSIDTWEGKGHDSRMRQHQQVDVGDILYMSESRKTNRVYQGIVLTKFMERGPTNPTFFGREDVRDVAASSWLAGGGGNAPHAPHWRDDEEGLEAWLEKSNEYICKVQWSEAREIDKTALNSGYIAATIVPRKSETAIALANQFAGAGRDRMHVMTLQEAAVAAGWSVEDVSDFMAGVNLAVAGY